LLGGAEGRSKSAHIAGLSIKATTADIYRLAL